MRLLSRRLAAFCASGALLVVTAWIWYVRTATVHYPSPERPWSVYVRRYRRAADAERAATRLRRDLRESAFVLKRNPPRSGTWFETHLGPWATTEPAYGARDRVRELGLPARVRNFEHYLDEIDFAAMATAMAARRPLVVARVDPELGPVQRPPNTLPADLKELLARIPYHPDFKALDLGMASWRTTRRPRHLEDQLEGLLLEGFYFPRRLSVAWLRRHVTAFVAVKFEDKLYGSRFALMLLGGGDVTAPTATEQLAARLAKGFRRAGYTIKYTYLSFDDNGIRFEAYKTLKTTITVAVWRDDPERLWVARHLHTDSGHLERLFTEAVGRHLARYGEVRHTLYTLPDTGATTPKYRLAAYRLDQIDDTYVEEKEHARWAEAMRGYWSAIVYLERLRDHRFLTMQLFDLRRPSYVRWVYRTLYSGQNQRVEERARLGLRLLAALAGNDPDAVERRLASRAVRVGDRRGWLVSRIHQSELNFAVSRWIVAIQNIPRPREYDRALRRAVAWELNRFDEVLSYDPRPLEHNLFELAADLQVR